MRCCFIEVRDRVLLGKIIGYCQRIEEYLSRYQHSFEQFQSDHLFQDACCMCVVQIGELSTQLSDDVRKANSSIPWRIIKDTRNFYVHAYGSIDVPAVWSTLNEDIPALMRSCQVLLGKN